MTLGRGYLYVTNIIENMCATRSKFVSHVERHTDAHSCKNKPNYQAVVSSYSFVYFAFRAMIYIANKVSLDFLALYLSFVNFLIKVSVNTNV